MKKMIALFVALVVLLPAVGLADPADVSSMTDDELKEMISACSAELMKRNTSEPEGIKLFDNGGMRVYLNGESYIDSKGYLKVPVIICNDLDERAAINIKDTICNGWDIMSNGGAETKAKSKKKAEMYFKVIDADVKEISDIVNLSFRWTVFSMETAKTLYEQEKPEEHRFW